MAAKTIIGPWTYRTPLVTIDYPAGKHQVADEIAAAFAEEGKINGDDGSATAGPAGDTGSPED